MQSNIYIIYNQIYLLYTIIYIYYIRAYLLHNSRPSTSNQSIIIRSTNKVVNTTYPALNISTHVALFFSVSDSQCSSFDMLSGDIKPSMLSGSTVISSTYVSQQCRAANWQCKSVLRDDTSRTLNTYMYIALFI